MRLARVAVAAAVMAIGAGVWVGSVPARAAEIAPANSRQALGQVIHELDMDAISLSKVIDYLRNASGSNLSVNWKALETAGVQKETPITLKVREVTLRKMLQLVLSQASPNAPLSYSIDSNVIQITTQDELDKQMVTKVYVVDDLVMETKTVQPPRLGLASGGGGMRNGGGGGGFGGGGGGGGFGGGNSGFGGGNSGFGGGNSGFGGGNSGFGGGNMGGGFNGGGNNSGTNTEERKTTEEKGQELVDLIKAVIRPNIWSDNGGTASIRYFSGKLIVTAPVSVQEAIGGPVGDAGVRYGM